MLQLLPKPALFVAIEQSNFELVIKLIIDGINIEERYDGRTPLHTAVLLGHINIVGFLLLAGANTSAIDFDGATPLFLAIFRDDSNIVDLLLAYKANCRALLHDATPFEAAITLNQLLIAQALERADPTITSEKALKLIDNEAALKNRTFMTFLADRPLGSWSPAWHRALFKKLPSILKGDEEGYYFTLRICCEQYTLCKTKNEQQATLKSIENLLKKLKAHLVNPAGTTLPFEQLLAMGFIEHIYLYDNPELSRLCAQYLPVPSSVQFEGFAPTFIIKREQEQATHIKQFLQKNANQSFATIENKLLSIQRRYRMKLRHCEEQIRIQNLDSLPPNQVNLPLEQALYQPQYCNTALAERMVKAAKEIKIVERIMHRTERSALTAILDDSLYGRKTLLRHMIDFKPAALSGNDADNGDANVICFGADHGSIDDIAEGEIELFFDYEKLSFIRKKIAHCAFFKQKDLEFSLLKTRRIKLDNECELCFDHTAQHDNEENGFAYLYAYLSQPSSDNFNEKITQDITGLLPYHELISYDIHNIHSRLILNFFKLLESNICTDNDKKILASIYDMIAKMNNNELMYFLQQIGKNASDTMEFNFYGAFKIEFSALNMIRNRNSGFELDLHKFIKKMNNLSDAVSLERFKTAQEALPELFDSYRFLDYLADNIQNQQILLEITLLRNACNTPDWYPSRNQLPNTDEASDGFNQPLKRRKLNITQQPSPDFSTPPPSFKP